LISRPLSCVFLSMAIFSHQALWSRSSVITGSKAPRHAFVMRFSGVGYLKLRGCLGDAVVLRSASGKLERLLSGPTPDPLEPARDLDAIARLRLEQAVRRSEFAIVWERLWPHLARFLT